LAFLCHEKGQEVFIKLFANFWVIDRLTIVWSGVGLCGIFLLLIFFMESRRKRTLSDTKFHYELHEKLKPQFGVLWDKRGEPYCPIHEKPLIRHKVKLGGKIETGLNCTECGKTIPLMNDAGKRLKLSEAKRLLKTGSL
jgi:hypothetical protein